MQNDLLKIRTYRSPRELSIQSMEADTSLVYVYDTCTETYIGLADLADVASLLFQEWRT